MRILRAFCLRLQTVGCQTDRQEPHRKSMTTLLLQIFELLLVAVDLFFFGRELVFQPNKTRAENAIDDLGFYRDAPKSPPLVGRTHPPSDFVRSPTRLN
jgi:hypothetical protein